MTEREAEQWAMGAHLAPLVGLLVPFGNLLGPFLIWQFKKGESELVDDQAKESLNFQITLLIAFVVCLILVFLLIGAFLLPLLGLAAIVMMIIAALQANAGEHYRYPVAIRFIK